MTFKILSFCHLTKEKCIRRYFKDLNFFYLLFNTIFIQNTKYLAHTHFHMFVYISIEQIHIHIYSYIGVRLLYTQNKARVLKCRQTNAVELIFSKNNKFQKLSKHSQKSLMGFFFIYDNLSISIDLFSIGTRTVTISDLYIVPFFNL